MDSPMGKRRSLLLLVFVVCAGFCTVQSTLGMVDPKDVFKVVLSYYAHVIKDKIEDQTRICTLNNSTDVWEIRSPSFQGLCIACEFGYLKIARRFIRQGAVLVPEALRRAGRNGHIDIVALLLRNGMRIDGNLLRDIQHQLGSSKNDMAVQKLVEEAYASQQNPWKGHKEGGKNGLSRTLALKERVDMRFLFFNK
jgi:hypothetical protein